MEEEYLDFPDEQQRPRRGKFPRGVRWIVRHFYLFALLLCVLAALFLCTASSSGDKIGNTAGSLVGRAVGSYQGVTEGIKEGAEAGKNVGLSAEDTEVRIGTVLRETRNLQILQVDFKLSDLHRQGDDYIALIVLPCTGVFTVDLGSSTAALQGDGSMLITIPKPEFTPYFDESQVEILAEYPPNSDHEGDAKDGYDGYLNSLEQLKANVRTEMTGYDTLMETAEQTALERVEQLARSVCGTASSVEVRFIEEGRK